MAGRVALMLVSLDAAEKLGARFKGLGQRIVAFYPNLKYDLINAQINTNAESYAVGSFASAAIWGLFAAIFMLVVVKVRNLAPPLGYLLPFIGLYVAGLVFMLLHLYYPRILAKNVSDKIDRGLIFAVRDMLIQTSSGIPLFAVISNIAEGDYGLISGEFKKVAGAVRSGTGLTEALEDMAVRNQSKYLKKTCWQLITAMRSGSNLTAALKGIIKLLVDYQMSLNKAYNGELNFVVLIYLMVAAVLPTVGTTVLVIFSVFGVLGVTPELYASIVFAGFVIQLMVIGYVYMKRPNMYV